LSQLYEAEISRNSSDYSHNNYIHQTAHYIVEYNAFSQSLKSASAANETNGKSRQRRRDHGSEFITLGYRLPISHKELEV